MIDDATARRLLDAAREAAARAYAPYSRFPVGAALLAAGGKVYVGANIENASYPLTCCAERVAVFHAVVAGEQSVRAIAVWAEQTRGVTPCGACRQVLNEWKPSGGDLAVVLDGADGPQVVPLAALLPRAFGPRDLAGSSSTGDGDVVG